MEMTMAESSRSPREILTNVVPLNIKLADALQAKIDNKTKPLGALGYLESLGKQLGLIQNRLDPICTRPTIVIFAADHGLAAEGVSPYSSEVTAQMVATFLAGDGAINIFAGLGGLELQIVDAGVAYPIPGNRSPIDRKIAAGTANTMYQAAMDESQLDGALLAGMHVVDELWEKGTNVVGLGEMGIGNSSAAALILSLLTSTVIELCTGRGTGATDAQLAHKVAVLSQVVRRIRVEIPTSPAECPWQVLRQCGGFEIAMMVGAVLRAAQLKMCILIDGFITTAAVLVAAKMAPHCTAYCVFSHLSGEIGHGRMLKALHARPLLDLQLRLGEGTGAALAYPLVQASARFLSDMASFASAGVSERENK